MKTKILWFLAMIVTLSLILRVFRITNAPVELFGDEIDVGIQAYSLLTTGKDYTGHPVPLSVTSFSESRLPFFIYFTVPFVKLFGLTELGVRAPAIALGIATLLLISVTSFHLFGKKIGVLTTILTALSPWHIHFSRWSNDNIGILFFTVSACYFFSKKNYTVSFILLALSFYAYSVSTIFTPLLGLALLLSSGSLKPYFSHKFVFSCITAALFVVPFFLMVISNVGSNRFAQISIFSDSTLLHNLWSLRARFNGGLVKYFRNRPVYYFQEFSNSYLRSFSTEFLFFNGDPILRHSVGGMGMLYQFEIVTLVIGLVVVGKNWSRPQYRLLLFWLLISPVSSALTKDGGNHAGRLIVMLPPLIILSAMGLASALKNKFVYIPLLTFAIFNFSFFMYRYHVEWPQDSWRFWQYGYKEALTYLNAHDTEYSRIFINNTYETALPRFLFWYHYSQDSFQAQNKYLQNKVDLVPGFNGFALDNRYYFGTISNLVKDHGFRQLLAPGDVYLASIRDEIGTDDWTKSPAAGLEVKKIIKSPTGEPLFAIITPQ